MVTGKLSKLVAAADEDIVVLSTLLQDAVLSLSDMIYITRIDFSSSRASCVRERPAKKIFGHDIRAH